MSLTYLLIRAIKNRIGFVQKHDLVLLTALKTVQGTIKISGLLDVKEMLTY